MVAGLAFLSKKSWHTKNMNNQERVWVAEQAKAQEEAKAKELAKQIGQEREQEEMDKIAGKTTTRMDRGIDWMYHGQQKNSEIAQEDAAKKSEEYLLGKAYASSEQVTGDLEAGATAKEGVNAVLEATKAPPVSAGPDRPHEPSVAERNEAFRMRHEDPMFAVAMQAKHKQDDYRKKKDLYERVVGVKREDQDKEETDEKDRKRHRKEKKHSKKKKKKRRRDYSSDEKSTDSRGGHRPRRRSQRSPTPDSYEDSRRRSRSRDRPEGHARHRDDRYAEDRDRRKDGRRGDRGYYSGGEESYDQRRRRDSGRYERKYSRSPNHDRRPYEPRGRDVDRYEKEPPREQKPGYGLQVKKPGYELQGAGASKPPPSDLGPDSELLRQKRQEREEQRELQRNQSSRRKMTPEERAAALRDMEESARKHQSQREKRPDRKDEEGHQPQASASFLSNVARKAHGVSDSSMSLGERISQNRNQNQRLHEDFV